MTYDEVCGKAIKFINDAGGRQKLEEMTTGMTDFAQQPGATMVLQRYAQPNREQECECGLTDLWD